MPDVVVPPDLAGERLDLALARLAAITRSAARRIIDDGNTLVDGTVVAARTRVKEGSVVSYPEIEEVVHLPDPTVEVDVLYEDDVLAVVDKPAGLVVHAGAGARVPTLASGLVARWPEMAEVGEPGRWGLVHRLDRDTSGALLVAKDATTLRSLQDALRRRVIRREYVALAEGHFGAPTGTVDAPIGRDPARPTRRKVTPYGRVARTHYRVEEVFSNPDVSRLAVRLETGRTHQIRVHMASIGHPLVGDTVYRTSTTPRMGLHRTWLHAEHLTFAHPSTGDELSVESPLPAALADTLVPLRDEA